MMIPPNITNPGQLTQNDVPHPRTGHSLVTVHDSLILYGGFDYNTGLEYDDLWKYNYVGGIWKNYRKPQEMTNATIMSSICVVGDFIYIFGGSGFPLGDRMSNFLVSFNVKNQTWQKLPQLNNNDQNIPPVMYGSSMVHFNGSLYLFGGYDGYEFLNSMFKFCLETQEWSRVPQDGEIPPPDYRVFGTVFQNQYYCFGGIGSYDSKRFEDVKVFDFSTNTWIIKKATSKVGQYPCERIQESFSFSADYGYLTGGLSEYRYLDDIWKIDLRTLEWEKFEENLGAGRYYHATSIVDNDLLYSFGGVCQNVDVKNELKRFILRPLSLYRFALESLSQSIRIKGIHPCLPTSIQDELDFTLR
ncbi:Kelch domain-containing protein 10 [Thelohanellus kitauei]|uniref:Kelch domain-containing protein 10 n=1 Tax=Thelohanellus kitauei TaxID=669202 RepID=A0A0C2J9G7_THEKT|nr:Kelch domain-containing protein 10 [Thelohanellus kitauei]